MLQDCGSVEAMGALTTLQGLPMWGTTSVTELPASLGLVSTLLAYGDNLDAMLDFDYTGFVGTSQVLEEDESGFLKAYHDESSGVTSLVRGIHEVRNFTRSEYSRSMLNAVEYFEMLLVQFFKRPQIIR
ncbi:hypothetical protein M758_1G113000 [Ceratodon purpureus]|nr:hypothetical protein M758_1G113000 [Ceratodon purpureus]